MHNTIYDTIKEIIDNRKFKYVVFRDFGMGLGEFKSLWEEREGDVLSIDNFDNCSIVKTEYGIFKLF